MTSPTYDTDGGSSPARNGRSFGSADAAERQLNGPPRSRPVLDPWEVGTIGEFGSSVYDMGATLFDVLSLPGTAGPGEDGRWGTDDDTGGIRPDDVFTWSIDDEGRQGRVTQMTLAGALSWLRNISATNKDQYNYIVALLVQSRYLSDDDARLNTYTNEVAAAFLQSVIDVHFVNSDQGAGAQTTWFDHIDQIIAGIEESGLGGDGTSGGGGGAAPEPPTRLNRYTDEMTVREAVTAAARNALGRSLTDAEEAAFVSSFRSLEDKWNDDVFSSQIAQFNGQETSITDAPNPGLAAQDFVESQHQPEANSQAFGSYMGVLRRMVGLGGEGIGSNIA
jgi:hypothetical protein